VETLENNRVRLSIEVGEEEFEPAIDAAFKRIAKEVRIPGFRPGKVPRKILEARIGGEAARQDALRESLPEFYALAVDEHDVDVIAPPEIDITAGQDDGAVAFDAVVEVRPRIQVPGYGSLRVEVANPEVLESDVEDQLERMRRQSAALEPANRPAVEADQVTIDVAASIHGEPVEGLTVDDYLYEVGSGMAVPELDEHLRGSKPGDILVFDADHPDPNEEHQLSFRVLVKEVQRPILPDLTDEWVAETTELETVEELRADLRQRVAAIKRVNAVLALRNGVIESLVQLVTDEPPAALVDNEVARRIEDLAHRLSHQGVSLQQYVDASGITAQQLVDDVRGDALSVVKADLAIRAVIEAEGIEADDSDVEAELERIAAQVEQPLDQVRAELERGGQLRAVRSDVQRTKALEWLAEHAEVVDSDGKPVDRALLEPPTLPEADETDETDEEPA
jgi:trigger factor